MTFDLEAAVDQVDLDAPLHRITLTGGSAYIAHREHVGSLAFIEVEPNLRRRGIGTSLLRLVGGWADLNRLDLYLLAHPMAPGAMDEPQLRAWYIAQGWEPRILRTDRVEVLVRECAVDPATIPYDFRGIDFSQPPRVT